MSKHAVFTGSAMKQSVDRILRRVVVHAVCALLAVGVARAAETVSFESLDANLTGGKPTTIQAVLY